MTTKLEQAARQALNALESAPVQYDFNSYPMLVMTPDTLHTTLTALRKALAEQAEPVAIVKENPFCPEGRSDELTVYLPVGTKLYTAPVRTKDLTDCEIEAIDDANWENDHKTWDIKKFARSVIAADRALNNPSSDLL